MDQVGLFALAAKLRQWDALIAGGAARNLRTKKPIKDIDVFIPKTVTAETVAKAVGASGECAQVAGYDGANMNVFKGYTYFGFPIDFIQVDEPRERWRMFPDTISQMWVGPSGIQASMAANLAIIHKTIECTNISEKRLARLQELYPETDGWKYVVHSRFEGCNKVVIVTPGKPRRDADHAPFWWDLPTVEKLAAGKAMDAVRALSEAYR